MGARVYLPSLGRFLSVDPIQGGTDNNYVYPDDPVNDFDLTGEWSLKNTVSKGWKAATDGAKSVANSVGDGVKQAASAATSAVKSTGQFIGRNADNIGTGLAVAGAATCIVATAGLCTGVAVGVAVASGVTTTMGAKYHGASWGKSLAQGGVETAFGLAGAKGARAVRWFGNGRSYTSVGKALSKTAGKQRLKSILTGGVRGEISSRIRGFLWDNYSRLRR